MSQLQCGVENGKRWIAGTIPMRKNVLVDVDTRTGKGLDVVLDHMSDTIKYHTSKVKLPSTSREDVSQELRVLVLAGVAEFDLTKETNLMTFLQNHLRNRIVNLYKFATERCRTPTHDRYRLYKIRCPDCRSYSLFDESAPKAVENIQCRACGRKQRKNEAWRKYPLPLITFSSDSRHPDGEMNLQDLASYEDLAAIGASSGDNNVETLINRIALEEAGQIGPPTNRLIIKHLLEGLSTQEICSNTNLTIAALRAQLAELGKAVMI